MQTKRIFIGFDISDDVRAAVAGYLNGLRRDFLHCPASWTRPEKLHFTLRFLGDVEAANVGRLCGVVEDMAARCPTFNLQISGNGVFPSPYKPRVLWLGARGGVGTVAWIKSLLDDELNSVGFESERKRFTPHLTLARLKDPIACRWLASRHLEATIETSEFTVREIIVYESKLLPSGSVYSAITRAKLLDDKITKD